MLRSRVLLAALLTLSAGRATVEAQPLRITFQQLASLSGDFSYELEIGPAFLLGVPPNRTRWTGPPGSSIVRTGSSVLVQADGFAELGALTFGDWRLESIPLPGQTAEAYQFSIAPFALEEVFAELATILSPTAGATVPREFAVEWAYAAGGENLGETVSHSQSGVQITGSFAPDPVERVYLATAAFDPGVRTGSVTFRAGSYEPNPTQVTGDAAFQQRFFTQVAWRNLSAPAAYRVVDQPYWPLLPGDWNADAVVNEADLPLWEAAWGTNAAGDANDDRRTDGADLLVWQRHFGQLPPPSVDPSMIAVPEPTAAWTSVAMVVIAAHRVERRLGPADAGL